MYSNHYIRYYVIGSYFPSSYCTFEIFIEIKCINMIDLLFCVLNI